jgi:hypothetical protein
MTVWTSAMKTIMLGYQELHDNDGIALWYCFLQHFAGTIIENLIEVYYQLSESKLHLHLFQDNILKFTNAVRAPIRHILKANEQPSFQHFLTIFHSCLDASNEEFFSYVMTLYSGYELVVLLKVFPSLTFLTSLMLNTLASIISVDGPSVKILRF